jgi:hypothetical protein
METNPMNKFEFLLGNWQLDYHIPKSTFSEAKTDKGTGSFRKALGEKYVIFEYRTESGSEAMGIFAWDQRINAYTYWWYENSGSYLQATCNFLDDKTLAMNWHDTLLVQTFVSESLERVKLTMSNPTVEGGYKALMEVILTRR